MSLAEARRIANRGAPGRRPRSRRTRTSRWPTADKKSSRSAKSAACFGELQRPKPDKGGHTRTQPCCLARLSAKTANGIGGVPRTKADKMETKALAQLAENAEENVSNHPWSVVSSR